MVVGGSVHVMPDGLAEPLRANAHASVLFHYWQALLPQDSQNVIQQ
jgi:hypothetical protein